LISDIVYHLILEFLPRKVESFYFRIIIHFYLCRRACLLPRMCANSEPSFIHPLSFLHMIFSMTRILYDTFDVYI